MIELTPLSGKYFGVLFEWERDEKLQGLVGRGKKLSFTAFSELWYELIARCKNCYYIILDDKLPMGFCNIYNIDRKNKNAEIGYYIGDDRYRFKGKGRIFLKKLLQIAFYEHNLHKIYAKTFGTNAGNIKFLKSFGFKEEGYLREDKFEDGQYEDVVIFGLLEKEFRRFIGMGDELI